MMVFAAVLIFFLFVVCRFAARRTYKPRTAAKYWRERRHGDV